MGGFYASKIGVLASMYTTTMDFTYMAWQQQTFFLHL